MSLLTRLAPVAFLGLLAVAPASAEAASKTVCVYDPAGRAGPIFGFMNPWARNAAAWGAEVELKPYTDEATAMADFDAGSCDAVAASGVRLQKYNKAAYTIEALGGIPDYSQLGRNVKALQTIDAYKWIFTQGEYEVAGVYPLGAVYAFVRDSSIDNPQALAGKKVATLSYDKTSKFVVDEVGGVKVPVDLSTLGSTFNNGGADVAFLPATAYTPFELWKGLGDNGAVIKYPITQVTLQIVLKPSDWPAGFGAKSRSFAAANFDEAMKAVKAAEAEIPAKYWKSPDPTKTQGFDTLLRSLRKKLLEDVKAYNGKVLGMLKRARCGADKARPECADQNPY